MSNLVWNHLVRSRILFILVIIFLCLCSSVSAIDYVNEKSSSKLTMTFTDEDGTAVTPTSGTYTIVDVDSGIVVKESTAFTPSSPTHVLTISSTENAIVNQSNMFEKHRITVTFTYGGSKTGTGDYIYRIRNLPDIN